MMSRLFPLLAAGILLVGFQTGCERHPASQTVPGFSEKQAKTQEELEREARTPSTINPEAPRFFPTPKQ